MGFGAPPPGRCKRNIGKGRFRIESIVNPLVKKSAVQRTLLKESVKSPEYSGCAIVELQVSVVTITPNLTIDQLRSNRS
jgi:hypothetical protein